MEECSTFHQYSYSLEKPSESNLCISSAEHAEATRRSAVTSLVAYFKIMLVLKGKFVFLSHKNGMEEWMAFFKKNQCSHFLEKPNDPISVLAPPATTRRNDSVPLVIKFKMLLAFEDGLVGSEAR